VYICGDTQLHFDWDGEVVGLRPIASGGVCETLMLPACTPVPQPWAEQFISETDRITEQVWLPSDTAPRGWRTIGVVTLAKDSVGSTNAGRGLEITAYCVDTQSCELLAEFDLDEMYSGLYGRPREELTRAAVHQASIGPDGAIGLIVCFTMAGDYLWDVGLWNDGRWTPLPTPQGYFEPGEIVVGPNNGAFVRYYGSGPANLLFYTSDGALLNAVSTSTRQLESLADRWFRQSAIAAAVWGSGALAAVALVGLIWWLLPLRRAAQRA